MKPFDPTKAAEYTDGSPARILCTDYKDGPRKRIVSMHPGNKAYDTLTFHKQDGQHLVSSGYDLVNTTEKHTVWFNVYHAGKRSGPNSFRCLQHTTEEKAKAAANAKSVVAIAIPFTFEYLQDT